MKQGMSLSTRGARFTALLERTVVTGRDGGLRDLESGIEGLCGRLVELRTAGNSLYLIGNGGSAGVAGHAAVDFFNTAKLRAMTLHEPSMLTCMSNDFGYENAFARMVSQMVRPGDVLIAISSSGNSMNIRNAAERFVRNGGEAVTFSGFAPDNALRSLGGTNFWLDSKDYGFVEIGHQFILHNISDRLNPNMSGIDDER